MSEDEVVEIVLAVLSRVASNAGAQGRDQITSEDIAVAIARIKLYGVPDGLDLEALMVLAKAKAKREAALLVPPELQKIRKRTEERLTKKYYEQMTRL